MVSHERTNEGSHLARDDSVPIHTVSPLLSTRIAQNHQTFPRRPMEVDGFILEFALHR